MADGMPKVGEMVYYVAPRMDKNSPILAEAALVVHIPRDAAGNHQVNLALDLAVFNADHNKPLAVRRIAVPYHARAEADTNPGNTWHFGN